MDWSFKNIAIGALATIGAAHLIERYVLRDAAGSGGGDEGEEWTPPQGKLHLEPGFGTEGEPGYRYVLVDGYSYEIGYAKLNSDGSYDVVVIGPDDREYTDSVESKRDIIPLAKVLIENAVEDDASRQEQE